MKVREPWEFLTGVCAHLKRIFGSDEAVTYLVTEENLLRLAGEGKEIVKLPLTGLIGESVKSNKVTDHKRSTECPEFNLMVDIETSESVKCIPIYHCDRNEIVAAVQYINKKGNMLLDKDVLEYFVKFACYAWEGLGEFTVDDDMVPHCGYPLKKK